MGYELDFSAVLTEQYRGFILSGLRTTLVIFVWAWVLGLALAILLTVLRTLNFKPLQYIVGAFVEYHRNVPVLIQLFFWYFGLASVFPRNVNMFLNNNGAEVAFAVLALAFNKAAYMSEDFRSGLRAIPLTQFEAARSIGLGYVGMMQWVILPQAWRIALPGLLGQTLFLFKATSIATAIGVAELTYQAGYIESQTFRVFEIFGIVTAIYMTGSFLLVWGAAMLARRFKLRTK